ncbi:MAG: helix-turn-helix transcriptional regulator [Peptoniphilaceae bacterium]|nr:helix-turn-helix transcriptional regulator [Peptoniphilaceae bacterium]MDY5841996.1 helix-turn-helix transcriptional regulator [Peptoniphilaceae bacterium]
MKLQNKLVQLRKKNGMSQLELAEALDVSRQAISKWELGTAIPTLDNLVFISKLYGVSVDYLVNDEMTSDFDTPAVKVTQAYYKLSYKRIILRIVIAVITSSAAFIAGIMNHSVSTALLFLLSAGAIIVLYLILHYLYRFITYRRMK